MRNILNIVVTALLLIVFVVLCFFVKCNLDVWFLVAAFVVLAAGSVLSIVQEKKLNK